MVEDQAAVVQDARVLPIEAPLPPLPICSVPAEMVVRAAVGVVAQQASERPCRICVRLPLPLMAR